MILLELVFIEIDTLFWSEFPEVSYFILSVHADHLDDRYFQYRHFQELACNVIPMNNLVVVFS